MTNNISIQKALAALVTNIKYINDYELLRNQIISELNLNKSDADLLDIFYEKNKNKFTSAAKILKKNRWDDIKLSLPITVKNIEQTKLNDIAEDYLNSHKVADIIPKNPLAESIIFAAFAEKNKRLSPLEQEIVKYERIRNQVTFKHHENFAQYAFSSATVITEKTMNKCTVYIHECFRIEEFSYNIPSIVNTNYIETAEMPNKAHCVVLFFKNLKKEGIGTLKISQDVRNIIEYLSANKNLLEIYEFYKDKLEIDQFLKFMTNLDKIGVLSIHNIEDI